MAPLDPALRSLLEARNIVHLATVLPDGAPHSVAVWAGVVGDRVAFFTQPTSRKARNVERDPRVAMSVVDRDNPYTTARLRGRVVETLHDDEALRIIDRVSQRYIGAPFPMRSGVVFLVEVESSTVTELPFREPPG